MIALPQLVRALGNLAFVWMTVISIGYGVHGFPSWKFVVWNWIALSLFCLLVMIVCAYLREAHEDC